MFQGESPGPERRNGESDTEMPPPEASPAPSAPPPDLPVTTALVPVSINHLYHYPLGSITSLLWRSAGNCGLYTYVVPFGPPDR